MVEPISFSEDYALVFQQRVRAFRENLDLESNSQARGEDRISQLPDAVLRHILSFIPSTKCVVRTSILSTRWKDVWACVPNLYLDDLEFSSSADFVAFVDRVLLVRDSSAIRKFRLHFNNGQAEDFSLVDAWIRTAVRCNVVELDLSVDSEGEEMFEWPESLLTCKTLMIWTLWLNHSIPIPTSGCCYPNLKVFHVIVSYPTAMNPDNDSMDFSHYPVLEHLTIDGSPGLDAFNFNISVPELKTLRISLAPDFDLIDACNFLINAPKLEKLDINEGFLSNYTFVNTKSLVEVNIGVITVDDDENDASANRATKFLAGISGVQCLTFSSPFSTACTLPVFDNLSKLMLVRDGDWWKILMKFLERTPNLESFEIKHETCRPRQRTEEEEVVIELTECRNPDYVEVLYWSPPESVPKCLLSSLKSITIKGFQGKGFFGYLDEMELIKYLLKNCLVLEKMTIYTPGLCWGTKDEFYNEISESEWGSKSVQVHMIEKEFYWGDGCCSLRAKRIFSDI
ncbi:hypothetical protein M0R45_014470 [Rubus argutus]|uniref:F-box domain-containing protein n=1 Tax=Rubus argutus TaxID=59490 RepID=A0AAW1XQ15_RUBAR